MNSSHMPLKVTFSYELLIAGIMLSESFSFHPPNLPEAPHYHLQTQAPTEHPIVELFKLIEISRKTTLESSSSSSMKLHKDLKLMFKK